MKNPSRFLLQCLCVGLLLLATLRAGVALVFVDSYSGNLSGATRIVLDANGHYAYATAFNSQTLSVFKRDPNSGKLTLVETHQQGINSVSGLLGAFNLALSPDDKHVYVAAFSENAIGIFSRNADGRLNFVQAMLGDANNGLSRPTSLAFDAQSKHLYVTSGNSVAVFQRDANSGLLSFVARYSNGAGAAGIGGATALRVSLDGTSVYVTGRMDNSLAFFQRDVNSGELSFVSHIPNDFNGVMGLGGAYDVQISPDDNLLLVSGSSDAAIAVFTRQADGRLAYQRLYENGADGISGLLGVQHLHFNKDGSRLFAVGKNDNALAMFEVLDGSGGNYLRFIRSVKQGTDGISTLSGISSATTDADSRYVYTSALNDNNISLFSVDFADLKLSMSAPAEVSMDASLSYQFSVENLGPGAAAQVTLSNLLPTQVSLDLANSDNRCIETAGTVTCDLGVLSAAQSDNLTLTVTANAAGVALNQASLSSSTPDNDLSNNSVQAHTQIINQQLTADLAVTLSVDTDPVNISRHFTYQAHISNAGPSDATNVVVSFVPPSGSSIVSTNTTAGSCSNLSGQVRCTLNNLGVNNPQLLSVTLVSPNQAADMTAKISVTASETDLQSDNNEAELSSRVEQINTDLALLSPILHPTDIAVGQVLSYEVGVRLVPPYDTSAASDAVLEATFAPTENMRFVSASTTHTNVSDPFAVCSDEGAGVVRCSLNTIDATANPLSVQISLLPIAAGSLSASFALSSSATDMDSSNNQATAENVTISGQAIDLALSLAAVSPDPAFLGNLLQYTFDISHSHATAAARNVTLSISLPATVDYIGTTVTQGSGCSETAAVVRCALGNIAAASSTQVILTVRPTSSDAVQISAQLGSESFDPDHSNNAITRSVAVQTATADLALSGTPTPQAIVDDELALDYSVANQGPSTANNAQFELQLPATLSYDLLSAKLQDGNDCLLENNSLRCSLGHLAINATSNIAIRLQVHEARTFSLTAALQSTVQDADMSNNSLSSEVRISQPLGLTQGVVYTNSSDGMSGLQTLFDLTFSSDGKFLYAGNYNQAGVLVLQREASSGALSFVQFLSNAEADVSGLGGVSQLALSSDETWLYAVGFIDDRLVVLQRDNDSGRLHFAQAIDGEDVGLQTLHGPFAVIARDNFVYVADFNADVLLVLQQQGSAGVSNLVGVQTVSGLDGLNGINALALSADATQLYASSRLDSSLLVFERDQDSGQLTFSQVLRDANTDDGIHGLSGAGAVLASADNQHVYVAGGASDSLVVFSRDTNNQLQYVQTFSDAQALSNVTDVALSADGTVLYATASNSQALTLLNRNPSSGLLSLQNSFVDGADGVQGLSGVRAVAISPDAAHVYTASLNSHAISQFRLPSADLAVSFSSLDAQPSSGQEISYTVQVQNLGADRATSTLLYLQIPTDLTLLDFHVEDASGTGGLCQHTQAHLQCRLGSLDNKGIKNLKLRLLAQTAGMYDMSANVTALQNDANPDNNSTTAALEIIGVANLVLGAMQADPPFANLGAEILYTFNLVNAGPDTAHNILLSNQLPAELAFVSAHLNGQACEFADSVINCRLSSLSAQESVSGAIRATVLQAVIIQNRLEVSSETRDLSLPNQAVATLSPLSNTISSEVDNSGQVLSNVLISATGVVSNGTLAGIVENHGRLNNVTLAAGAQLSGSGSLSGIINNAGTIQTARLRANSELNGGRVSGLLVGSGSNAQDIPRLRNVRIEASAELRNVLVDETVVLDEQAVLGAGVKFSHIDLLPLNTDLSGLFSTLQEPFTHSKALQINVSLTLRAEDNLLLTLNASPDMDGLEFSQNAGGHLSLQLAPLVASGRAVQVIRRPATPPLSLEITPEGTAAFISSDHFQVVLQPALRSPAALDEMLADFGLDALSQQDGNINVPLPANSGRFLVRPDWFDVPADSSLDPSGVRAGLGFQPLENQPSLLYAVLFFTDEFGARRQQVLYPVAADRNAWLNNSSLSQLELLPDGLLKFTQDGRQYAGLFDYTILPTGVASGDAVIVAPTSDQNDDGIADLLVTYPNGEQQKIFLQ